MLLQDAGQLMRSFVNARGRAHLGILPIYYLFSVRVERGSFACRQHRMHYLGAHLDFLSEGRRFGGLFFSL